MDSQNSFTVQNQIVHSQRLEKRRHNQGQLSQFQRKQITSRDDHVSAFFRIVKIIKNSLLTSLDFSDKIFIKTDIPKEDVIYYEKTNIGHHFDSSFYC